MAANAGNAGNGGRRDNGQGSAYYDQARGRWRGEITLGTRPDGRRDVRKVTAATKAAALKALAEIRRAYERGALGTVAQERETVAAFLDRWLLAKASSVRPTSLRKYTERLRGHIVPHLGGTPLKALTPAQLQTTYAALLTEGLHPRTVRSVHRALSAALRDAVRWGELPRNVAQVVTPPAVAASEITPPTALQVARLLAAAERDGDRLVGLWTLAALTGARLGELTGLRWSDLDLDAGVLHIRRSLTAVLAGGAPVFSAPKTARSRRRIPLSSPALAALKAHRIRQHAERLRLPTEWGLGLPGNADLVFVSEIGTALRGSNARAHWAQARARAGLPASTRFHDLRHYCATAMLAAGIDVVSVSGILGHANASITLGVYGHAIPDRLALGTDVLGALLTQPAAEAV